MTSLILFIGTTEMLMIAGVVLLLFGGKKLPEMMHGMGKGVKEFKKGIHEIEEPVNEVKETVNEAINLSKIDSSTEDERKADSQKTQ